MRTVPASFGLGLFGFTAVLLLSSLAGAQSGNLHLLAGSTPGLVAQAQDLGAENPARQITIYVWLKRHNEAAFEQLLRKLYTKGSPQYHRWLSNEQYIANFGPSAAEAGVVSDFLESHHLNVTEVDPLNQYVSAEGSVADVQATFRVQINRFSLGTSVHRSNTGDVTMEGPAGEIASAVLGLDDIAVTPFVRRQSGTGLDRPVEPTPIDYLSPGSITYHTDCWGGGARISQVFFSLHIPDSRLQWKQLSIPSRRSRAECLRLPTLGSSACIWLGPSLC